MYRKVGFFDIRRRESMKEQIEKIRTEALQAIQETTDAKQLEEVRVKYLGKKSELTNTAKGISSLPKSERPAIGGLVIN